MGFEFFSLLLAQMRRHLDDVITLNAVTQRLQELQRQAAVTRAKLQHIAGARVLQCLLQAARQCHAKKWRHKRRGDEIAAAGGHAAYRLAARTVITHPRRIQNQGHETVERQPARLCLQAGLQ